jgi:hypothetical protein
MPVGGEPTFQACVDKMQKKERYSEETARKVCGKLEQDTKKSIDEKPDHPTLNKAEWIHALPQILQSSRIVEMTFHVPKVDKDKEFITADAMAEALEHYRHFPIISEFHKERPIGIAEKIWQTSEDEFKAIARIREDPSVDDVWEKIESGQYNQVSIAGRRTEYSPECNLHQSVRSAEHPCTTTGLRLDSISVCDEAARNTDTDLHVVKADTGDPSAFVYTTALVLTKVKDTLIKAETSNSPLIHQVTDGTRRKAGEKGVKMKKCNQPPVKKGDEEEEKKETEEKAAPPSAAKDAEVKAAPKGESESEEETREEDEEDQEKAKKAEPEEEQKAETLETKVDRLAKAIEALVASDKKVHSEIKAEEPPKEEKKEVEKTSPPKGAINPIVKADLPPAPPAPVIDTSIIKAEMEQDFQKAITAAVAPLTTEIETLKKANKELSDKLEAWGNETIVKSGIYMLNVDQKTGNPVLTNAGAVAQQTYGKVKPE